MKQFTGTQVPVAHMRVCAFESPSLVHARQAYVAYPPPVPFLPYNLQHVLHDAPLRFQRRGAGKPAAAAAAAAGPL